MPGLRELRIGLQDVWWVRSSLELEAPWVRPVREVRGLDVFEVEIVEEMEVHDLPEWEKSAQELRKVVCRGREEDEGEDGMCGM